MRTMVERRGDGAIDSAEAIGRGLAIGVATTLAAGTVLEASWRLWPLAEHVACASIVGSVAIAACVVAARGRRVAAQLLGLLAAAPLGAVVIERELAPLLVGVRWSVAIAVCVAMLAVVSRGLWTLTLAPGLDGLLGALRPRAASIASVCTAATLALGASAVTVPHVAGLAEWQSLESFMVEVEPEREEGAEIAEARLMLSPLVRSATVLRLPEAVPEPLPWRSPRNEELLLDRGAVWRPCEPMAPTCPIGAGRSFAILEMHRETLVVQARGADGSGPLTYCSLHVPRSSTLPELASGRLGAPREVSVLVVLAGLAGLCALLASHRALWSSRAGHEGSASYREASLPPAIASPEQREARARELALLGLALTVWLALPALVAHACGFVVGLF